MTEDQILQLNSDIRMGWKAQDWLCVARQARIAKATQMLEKANIEGVGEMTMRLDPFVFHSWAQKNGGYHIWSDKNFVKKFKQDNPSVRVTRPRRSNKVGYGD